MLAGGAGLTDGPLPFRRMPSPRWLIGPSRTAALWLLMQHVLPQGLRRARNFGFLHPTSKRLIALLQWVLKLTPMVPQTWMKVRPPLPCPCCGAAMQIVRRRMAPASPQRTPDETLTGVAML